MDTELVKELEQTLTDFYSIQSQASQMFRALSELKTLGDSSMIYLTQEAKEIIQEGLRGIDL